METTAADADAAPIWTVTRVPSDKDEAADSASRDAGGERLPTTTRGS